MFLLSWGIASPSLADIAYYNLFIVEGETPIIYQLEVLYNGQIVDPHIQYDVGGDGFDTGDIAITNDYRFLLAIKSGNNNYGINRYQILPNGNLFLLGSTPGTIGYLAITHNNELVVVGSYVGNSLIYSLTSTGDLINGTVGPVISSPQADPLGRGILALSAFAAFSAYTINYALQSLDSITTFPTGTNVSGFQFTPNGKLGFIYGMDATPEGYGLGVMKIGANFTFSTTQILNPGDFFVEIASNSYLLGVDNSCGCIKLFSIDTLGNVTDTGKVFGVPSVGTTGGTLAGNIRQTPGEQMAVVYYEDGSLDPQGGSFATAWVAPDGSLSWTGYSYAFDSVYGGNDSVTDFVIVPVYTTDVPKELWDVFDDQ